MKYSEIKTGMAVDFWTQGTSKKRMVEIDEDDPLSGTGTVIFSGPHFVTIKTSAGWKVTVTQNDLLTKRAIVEPVKKVFLSPSLFVDSAMP